MSVELATKGIISKSGGVSLGTKGNIVRRVTEIVSELTNVIAIQVKDYFSPKIEIVEYIKNVNVKIKDYIKTKFQIKG